MTNAMEPIGKHVEQETAHELTNAELHDFVLVVAILTIILPAKADVVIVETEETAVANCDTVRVAREIRENLRWSRERALGVDDPLDAAQGSKVGSECVSIFEASDIGEELEFSRIVQCLKTFEEQAPK
jgi:hypothetical protein